MLLSISKDSAHLGQFVLMFLIFSNSWNGDWNWYSQLGHFTIIDDIIIILISFHLKLQQTNSRYTVSYYAKSVTKRGGFQYLLFVDKLVDTSKTLEFPKIEEDKGL